MEKFIRPLNDSSWPQAPIRHLKVPIYKRSVVLSEVKLP